MATPILESTLTCPVCGHAKIEPMPTDVLRMRGLPHGTETSTGARCVFCSYGRVPCPPIQMRGTTGGCCSR